MGALAAPLRARLLERRLTRVAWLRNSSAIAHKRSEATAPRPALEKEVLEGIVGYPTPIMRLRAILGNDLTNLSTHIRRLLSSQHPVVKNSWSAMFGANERAVVKERCFSFAYRKLFGDSQVVLGHGPLTLLVSKAANLLNETLPDTDQYGILPSQRALVEVMEMISAAHLIYAEVVDVGRTKADRRSGVESTCSRSDLTFGNKMVVLGGGLLLARACKELAQLYRPRVSPSQTRAPFTQKRFH